MILQEGLALSSMYIRGNVDQIRAAIERGLALEEAFGDRRHQLQLGYGLYRLLMRLGDFRAALAGCAAECNARGGRPGRRRAWWSRISCSAPATILWETRPRPNFTVSEAWLAQPSPGRSSRTSSGFDHRIYAPISLARTLWLRGFPDQARGIAEKAVDGAASRDDPLTTCVALTYCSPVFLWSGDFRTADDYIERLIEYARRHSLEPYRAAGLGLKGALAVARDEAGPGLDLLRSALETLSVKKLNILLTLFAGALAEGLRMTGQLEEALLTVNGAIARAQDCGSTYDMPELLRIKAQILAAMPRQGRASAVNCLTEAIEVARIQSALALELRSTMTLARLLSEGGQRDQARRELALVHDRFTEGFQTEDLKQARALLEDLQSRS